MRNITVYRTSKHTMTMVAMKIPLLAVGLLPLLLIAVHASAEAHLHTGKLTPFQAGDPGVKLNGKALKILSSGKPYQTQVTSDGESATAGGRGMVVQDVNAPADIVWETLLNFKDYPKMVPKTAESKTYRIETLRHGQKRIFVRMKVGFPMLKLLFYVNHHYDPRKNSMTWTLDYSKASDFDDSVGYWYVIPHPDNPNHCRVYYSVQVSMFSWVPNFAVDFLSNKGLTDATAWVKKFSEVEYAARGGDRKEPAPAATTTPAVAKAPKNKKKKKQHDTAEDTSSEAGTVNTVRITRIGLVSTVLALAFYNVHLYFSQ